MFGRLLTVPGLPEVDMPAVRELTALQQQITEALAEVRGARATWDHCPSTVNQEFLAAAEFRLARLLDRLPRQREAT